MHLKINNLTLFCSYKCWLPGRKVLLMWKLYVILKQLCVIESEHVSKYQLFANDQRTPFPFCLQIEQLTPALIFFIHAGRRWLQQRCILTHKLGKIKPSFFQFQIMFTEAYFSWLLYIKSFLMLWLMLINTQAVRWQSPRREKSYE